MGRIKKFSPNVATVAATGIATITASQFPQDEDGLWLVGLILGLGGTTHNIGQISKLEVKTDKYSFFRRTPLHDRQWKERHTYRGEVERTDAGVAAGALVSGGAYAIWFNDQRALNPDRQDDFAAPSGKKSMEITYSGAPTAGTISLTGIYSTVKPSWESVHLASVPNVAASSPNTERIIEEPGNLLAYGVPYTSDTIAAQLARFRMKVGGITISDGNIPAILAGEYDDSNFAAAASICDPAAASVIWCSARGFELPGPWKMEFEAGSDSLASTEFPYWARRPRAA